MRKQHRDTSIRQAVPDAASDSDGSHLPVLGKGKQKPKWKHWGNVQVVCMKQCGTGEQGSSSHSKHLALQGDTGSRQKRRLFARTQSFSAWDLTEFPAVPLSFRTFSLSQ